MTYSTETTTVIDFEKFYQDCKSACKKLNLSMTRGLLDIAGVNLSSVHWSNTIFTKLYDPKDYPDIKLGAMRDDLLSQVCFGFNLNPSDYVVKPTSKVTVPKHTTKLLHNMDEQLVLDLDAKSNAESDDLPVPASSYIATDKYLKFYIGKKLYIATALHDTDTTISYILDTVVDVVPKDRIHSTIMNLYKSMPLDLVSRMGGNSMRCPSVAEVFGATDMWKDLRTLGFKRKLGTTTKYFSNVENRVSSGYLRCRWWCNTPSSCEYGIAVDETGNYTKVTSIDDKAGVRPIITIHKNPEQTINVPRRKGTEDNKSESKSGNKSENTVIGILDQIKTLSKPDVLSLTTKLAKYIEECFLD